jgi:acyl-CoA thioesterase-1
MSRFFLLSLLLVSACSPAKAPDPAPSTQNTPTPAAALTIPANAPVILAFGDSLYAGYQLQQGQGYPARLEAALNAGGTPVRVVPAAVSGDTTAAGLQRLAFALDNQPAKPTLVMVGLGGNDMLRGLPPEQTRANLDAILAELKRRKLPAMLTGMLAAPNMGADYVQSFNMIYPALSKKYEVPLIPFFLAPVFGHKEWILDDNIHPNAVGIDKIVDATKGEVAKALDAAEHRP